MTSGLLPHEAEVVDRQDETPDMFSLRLRFTDPEIQTTYRFALGQFNMLCLPGLGEVPISIVSDPDDRHAIDHTIRQVGSLTRNLGRLEVGDRLGLRGPYGRGWPAETAEGTDLLIVTGGLGCAPSVSLIEYALRRRSRYGRIHIIQGVKHAHDLIWRERYSAWRQHPDVEVYLTADTGDTFWPFHVGPVTQFFERIAIDPAHCSVFLCGPEGMMRTVIQEMVRRDVPAGRIWLSMERNMHCALGSCGRCQLGPKFVCRDGPVFSYAELAPYLAHKGV
ncbi:FAD/NAD(P)-binding protein [Halomonas cerina]|uniref:NAD(P)H-flavin reductase n=1 Tax=Halomonas cerina TaxID=447424 RepID=A0A839V4S7_9GAMM|nr:FAD/NAD(P)-binding protein [Halomonas cerina]MBB3190683.1 NAD(P)H-flavin reductase [Halomonas cerina]